MLVVVMVATLATHDVFVVSDLSVPGCWTFSGFDLPSVQFCHPVSGFL